MIGEYRQLILQMNRLSLRNNRLKFTTAGKLPIILEESIEVYSPFNIPILCPKNLPDHWALQLQKLSCKV
jgi:hypothetical protein